MRRGWRCRRSRRAVQGRSRTARRPSSLRRSQPGSTTDGRTPGCARALRGQRPGRPGWAAAWTATRQRQCPSSQRRAQSTGGSARPQCRKCWRSGRQRSVSWPLWDPIDLRHAPPRPGRGRPSSSSPWRTRRWSSCPLRQRRAARGSRGWRRHSTRWAGSAARTGSTRWGGWQCRRSQRSVPGGGNARTLWPESAAGRTGWRRPCKPRTRSGPRQSGDSPSAPKVGRRSGC